VLSTDELLKVYRLQGLIELAREDKQGAIYATIRMVTIDPDAPPSPDLGPEIAQLQQSWAGRLSEAKISLVVTGDGDAWVDGRAIGGSDAPTVAVAGEHLVQAHDAQGWHAVVQELDKNTRVQVGTGLKLVAVEAGTPPPPVPVFTPAPPHPPPPLVPKAPGPFARPHRTSLLVVGGAGVAVGAGALIYGLALEHQFHQDDYLRPAFGDCQRGDPCYPDARAKAIRDDATTIRALYASGYVVGGLGITTLGMELFVLPAPTAGGGSVGLRGTW